MSNAPFPPARFAARIVVPLALLVSTTGLLLWSARGAFESVRPVEVAPVALVEGSPAAGDVSESSFDAAISAPGWIEPSPFATEVRALRAGVIAETLVLEGEVVAAGQIVARLERAQESIALATRDAELAAARAVLEDRRARRIAAERSLALRTEPRRAEAEAASAVAEARAARGTLEPRIAAARARARAARDLADRNAVLVASGATGPGEVRRLALEADALEAEHAALEASRATADAVLLRAEATLAAARTVLTEAVDETQAVASARALEAESVALVALAEARRAEACLALERSDIRSPVAGAVMAPPLAAGGGAGPSGEPVARVYDPRRLQVRCDVPARELARLAVGARAEVTVEGLPGAVLGGRVARIVPLGDVAKNTHECKVVLDGPDEEAFAPFGGGILRPDLLVRVRIATREGGAGSDGGGADGARGRERTAVPTSAIRGAGAAAFVLVAVPDGARARCERRAVEPGRAREDGWTELLAGPPAGDRVVLDPVVEEGALVSPVERLQETLR